MISNRKQGRIIILIIDGILEFLGAYIVAWSYKAWSSILERTIAALATIAYSQGASWALIVIIRPSFAEWLSIILVPANVSC